MDNFGEDKIGMYVTEDMSIEDKEKLTEYVVKAVSKRKAAIEQAKIEQAKVELQTQIPIIIPNSLIITIEPL